MPVGAEIGQLNGRTTTGRRDKERKRFTRLMKEVDRIRIREGWTNAEFALQIGTGENVVSGWRNGRAIGRQGAYGAQ
jgi:DNA-binding transcriptional regulator YiaG